MKRRNLIIACTLMTFAAAMALSLIRKNPTPAQAQSIPERRVVGKTVNEDSMPLRRPTHPTKTGDRLVVSATTIGMIDGTSPDALEKVRRESMRKLDQLTKDLRLSQMQRLLLLPALVANSEGFLPNMTVDGKPVRNTGAAIEDAICEVLNDPQKTLYQDSLLDDAAWWEDALTQFTSNDEPDDPETDAMENP